MPTSLLQPSFRGPSTTLLRGVSGDRMLLQPSFRGPSTTNDRIALTGTFRCSNPHFEGLPQRYCGIIRKRDLLLQPSFRGPSTTID